MQMIKADALTKDYAQNRGIFDISFETSQGEVYGFLGPNGAGKTTTIRNLLGFVRPQRGACFILGLDCWTQSKQIQRHVGYVPGEIAFPEHLTGYEFLEQISDLRQMTSLERAKELISFFDLDPRAELKRMSKGTKQKIALVTAFMHQPEIVILDEPTSGLDPLMQSRFVELIRGEKAKGCTIFMSSHMFDEVEKTCDRVAVIKQGRIVTEVRMKDIEHRSEKVFEIKLSTPHEVQALAEQGFVLEEINPAKTRVVVRIQDGETNKLIAALSAFNVLYISEIKYNLEQCFMHYYQGEEAADA